jgi:ankyrin repeat protein
MDPICETTGEENTLDITKISILEEEWNKNLDRIRFSMPQPKHIISHHTGCEVLVHPAQDADASEYLSKIPLYFSTYPPSPESKDPLTEKYISSSETKLRDFLHYLGFPVKLRTESYNDMIEKAMNRIFFQLEVDLSDEKALLSESQLSVIVSKFYLSTHFNGHKLRKYCARGQTLDIIELVIRGCSVNARDGDGLSALHYACEMNRPEIIQLLYELGQGQLQINSQDRYGWTPAHSACHHGSLTALQTLIKYNVGLDIGDSYGKTPLHLAAARGHIDIIQLLLNSNVSVSKVCDRGMTAAHEAAFKMQTEAYDVLKSHASYDASIRDALGYLASDYLIEEMYNARELQIE